MRGKGEKPVYVEFSTLYLELEQKELKTKTCSN